MVADGALTGATCSTRDACDRATHPAKAVRTAATSVTDDAVRAPRQRMLTSCRMRELPL
jgi:hypothetical protein